ncbi:MAG: hypothetical protein HYY95_17005 [Candidatus Rokubacteria bacterium]|nr:hypothetical protein [Candidatus Rokubacteria bacterium]MBI3107238.1 hypothetical protein [Candidatus Rokubacteria bacterium]
MSRRASVAVAVLALAAAAGCTSPEATRMRAGGPGADVGNRGDVELHGGSRPYYRTPTEGGSLLPRPRSRAETAASPAAR